MCCPERGYVSSHLMSTCSDIPDNHMINGTKLLNVAGMTRGRRDGILKSEKARNVVKIGPMHLKGVWYVFSLPAIYSSSDSVRIPFERALDFANKEKITDLLYPLFVHQIAELLYHPTNSNQTNMVVQDSQQRRLEGPQARTPQGPPPPALHHHHHHHMQNNLPPHLSQPPHSLSSQPGGRPVLDRANSFPTPPASASSLMGISHQGGSYDWNNQGINSGVQNSQPISIENSSLNNARSMPTTPATTPPGGNGLQGMPPFQGQPAYDSSKPYYSAAPPSNSQYAPQPLTQPAMPSYGQPLAPGPYLKSDMAPPGRSAGQEAEVTDVRTDRYNQTGQAADSVPEHESEYIHDNASGYNSRGSYTYASNPSVGALTEQPQLTPDVTGSPSQQNSSGRMTPRTGGGPPSQWPSGYHTPPRPPVGSLYNIVSDTRGSSTNGGPPDTYGVSNSTPGYSTAMNGSLGIKRLRDDDEVDRVVRPDSRGADYESKRRKTLTDPVGPVGAPLALQPVKAGGVMGRH